MPINILLMWKWDLQWLQVRIWQCNWNGNLDYFYRRCATEGGSQPLRTRCLKCCPNSPPPGEDGECYKEVFKGCATDQDQNKCSQEVCGYQVKKCVCEGVSLCNQQGNCTQCSKASVQNPMIIKHLLFVIALVLIVPFSLVEYCIWMSIIWFKVKRKLNKFSRLQRLDMVTGDSHQTC